MNARRAIFLTCLGLASIPIYALNFRFAEILQKVNLISSKGAPFVSFLYQMLVLWVIYLIAAGTVLRSEAADRNNAAIFIILFFRDPLPAPPRTHATGPLDRHLPVYLGRSSAGPWHQSLSIFT